MEQLNEPDNSSSILSVVLKKAEQFLEICWKNIIGHKFTVIGYVVSIMIAIWGLTSSKTELEQLYARNAQLEKRLKIMQIKAQVTLKAEMNRNEKLMKTLLDTVVDTSGSIIKLDSLGSRTDERRSSYIKKLDFEKRRYIKTSAGVIDLEEYWAPGSSNSMSSSGAVNIDAVYDLLNGKIILFTTRVSGGSIGNFLNILRISDSAIHKIHSNLMYDYELLDDKMGFIVHKGGFMVSNMRRSYWSCRYYLDQDTASVTNTQLLKADPELKDMPATELCSLDKPEFYHATTEKTWAENERGFVIERKQSTYRYPVDAPWTERHGSGVFEQGQIYLVEAQRPVYAIGNGNVEEIHYDDKNLLSVIRIKHAGNYISVYAHLTDILVQPGDKVQKGDLIGTVSDLTDEEGETFLFFTVEDENGPLKFSELLYFIEGVK